MKTVPRRRISSGTGMRTGMKVLQCLLLSYSRARIWAAISEALAAAAAAKSSPEEA